VLHYNIGCLYALSGELEKALTQLQIAHTCGYNNVEKLTTDEDLRDLHEIPGFWELMEKMAASN